VEAAIDHYQKALELNPEFVPAFNNLAWVLATCPRAPIRNGARAVELAQRAKRLSGGANLTILRTLAAAYAEAGRFPEALEAAGQALDLATRQGNAATIDALQREIRLYRDGSPLRDWSQAP
jgi:tetratricopeptide (TPR) repeat protein